MSVDVLTPGERQLVESAKPRRDDLVHLVYRLVAEVDRLRRPRTQHCPVCEASLAERDRYARALRRVTRKHIQLCAWAEWDAGHSVGDKMDKHVAWLMDREEDGPWRETWKGWKR